MGRFPYFCRSWDRVTDVKNALNENSHRSLSSGGTGTYWMAKSILEGWTVGSMFIAFGITRLTNQNKKSIKDDIVDIFMPNEVGIGENIVESATSDKWGNHNE